MISELRNAFAFLTILPVGYDEHAVPGRSFTFYPIVGLAIGLILFLSALVTSQWLSPAMTGFLVLIVWVILTGGLHLDGFGDSCDGLFATVNPERRLEIMKDSRAGSWAVIGLVLLLLGKWVALQNARPVMLLLIPVIGRWAMVITVYVFPYARATGLGAHFRNGFGRWQIVAASILTFLTVVGVSAGTIGDFRLLVILPTTIVVVWIVGRWAASRLGGGLTGDVYGALCELVELTSLILVTSL